MCIHMIDVPCMHFLGRGEYSAVTKPHFSGVHVQGQLREKQVLQVYHKARPALSPLKFFHRPFAYHSFGLPGTWHQTPPRKHFLTQPPLPKKKGPSNLRTHSGKCSETTGHPYTLVLRVSNYFFLLRAFSLLFQKALQTLQEQATRAQLYRILILKKSRRFPYRVM